MPASPRKVTALSQQIRIHSRRRQRESQRNGVRTSSAHFAQCHPRWAGRWIVRRRSMRRMSVLLGIACWRQMYCMFSIWYPHQSRPSLDRDLRRSGAPRVHTLVRYYDVSYKDMTGPYSTSWGRYSGLFFDTKQRARTYVYCTYIGATVALAS
jgi:hypothetical protein